MMQVSREDRLTTGLVLAKLRVGEPISDDELAIAIKVLTFILPIMRSFGDSYRLFAEDLQRRLSTLEDYQQARRQDH